MEIKNKETIMEDLSNNLDEKYEKNTPGFLIYDLNKSTSIILSELYETISNLIKKVDVDNLIGEELNKYTRQRRGIERKEATFSLVDLKITGTGNIKKGDIFSTEDDLNFLSLEDKEIIGNGNIKAQCEISGEDGIVSKELINQIPVTIPGIIGVSNESNSYDGFNAEGDSELRERYYLDLRSTLTSNNINHFKKWANETQGVGRSKVIPTWNGNNSVKVFIIDSNMLPASSDLVSKVQEHIDPIDASKWGKGYGESALGSFCTVESASSLDLVVEALIVKNPEHSLEEVKNNIEESIKKYLREVAFSDVINYISYSKVVQAIMDSDFVLDASDIKLNTKTINIDVLENNVAILQTLTIRE